MSVRVIYRTEVCHNFRGPENFTALMNDNQLSSPPILHENPSPPSTETATTSKATSHHENSTATTTTNTTTTSTIINPTSTSTATHHKNDSLIASHGTSSAPVISNISSTKSRKSERGESFPKLRLSPKSFRFSGRFGRSKSEIEKCPNDPVYNYSKSFQEVCTRTLNYYLSCSELMTIFISFLSSRKLFT